MRNSHRVAFVVTLVLSLALGACGHRKPTAPAVARPEPPRSPEAAVTAVATTWTQRDTAAYLALLTDDFEFVFAASDSSGNPWRSTGWGRPPETNAVGHLLVGGGDRPPASSIQFKFGPVILIPPDPRPGCDPRVHRAAPVTLSCRVTIDRNGQPEVTMLSGSARFFLVRGDSAALSPAHVAGGGRDSTRWYIERWEDQTGGTWGLPAHTLPAANWTIGAIKALYVTWPYAPAP